MGLEIRPDVTGMSPEELRNRLSVPPRGPDPTADDDGGVVLADIPRAKEIAVLLENLAASSPAVADVAAANELLAEVRAGVLGRAATAVTGQAEGLSSRALELLDEVDPRSPSRSGT